MNHAFSLPALLIITALPAAISMAEDKNRPADTVAEEEQVDWGDTQKKGGALLGTPSIKRPGKTRIIRQSHEVKHTIELKRHEGPEDCESSVDLEYYQKDTIAEIHSLFTTPDCAAFNGRFELEVTYVDSTQEIHTDIMEADWPAGQREPLVSDFPLPADSDLLRVRSNVTACTCREESAGTGEQPTSSATPLR